MSRSREWPIAIRSVELGDELRPLTGLARYSRVRVFVSLENRLLGSVDIWNNGADVVSVYRLRDAVAGQLAWRLRDRLSTATASAVRPFTVSIVLPSCERADDLHRCLTALAAQRTRHTLEILVVDNRPAGGTARRIAQAFPDIRIIDEHRPGLSFARNTGILCARGEIIVMTDDDVVAPKDWIERLVAPFARDEVAAVTGNVLPLELDSEAQCRFEAYGGLGRGFLPVEVDGGWFRSRRTAVPTWQLGATANAAFRASVFAEPDVGLLDEALGAGTPTGCSEDTDLFYRILRAGHTIVYEPTAWVWHRHRTTLKELRQQIYSYSKGHVAYQLTTLLRYRDGRAVIRLLYSLPKTYAGRAWYRLRGYSDYPISLIGLEVLGNLVGPFALWRARRRARLLGLTTLPAVNPVHHHAVSMEGQVPQGPPA